MSASQFPPGRCLNFLGTGAIGVKPFAAISRSGRFAPHLNLAYQWNGSSIIGGSTPGVSAEPSQELFLGRKGADVSLNKRLTIAGSILASTFSRPCDFSPSPLPRCQRVLFRTAWFQ